MKERAEAKQMHTELKMSGENSHDPRTINFLLKK